MRKLMNKLNDCQICGGVIPRRKTESWPSYYAKTACSHKCAATLRDLVPRKEREAIAKAAEMAQEKRKNDAQLRLMRALHKWPVQQVGA